MAMPVNVKMCNLFNRTANILNKQPYNLLKFRCYGKFINYFNIYGI